MKENFLKMMFVFALLAFTTMSAFAQGRGILTGRVLDNHGDALPGATVVVQGTTIGTVTDLNGQFILQNIAPGNVTFVVSFLGFDPVEGTVQIRPGETTTRNFVMNEGGIELAAVTVSGAIAEQQRALNQRRNAPNMMQVVSADEMGRFPDRNVAEALQRLSGVTITRSRGEGSGAQLRGTPGNFVNIMVDGNQLMGAEEGGVRNISLDVIPADILASMEVQKTLLPSNDGDAVAGVINMRTATARSLTPRRTIDIGSGYGTLRGNVPASVRAGYQQRFFPTAGNQNGAFGVMANFSFLQARNGYDRLEQETRHMRDLRAFNPVNGNINAAARDANATLMLDEEGNRIQYSVPEDFRHRFQDDQRTRIGATLTLDYAPTTTSRILFSAMYSRRQDEGVRHRNRFQFRDFIYGADAREGSPINVVNGILGANRARSIYQITQQNITVETWNFQLSGETALDRWRLDGGLFLNLADRVGINPAFNFQTPDWRTNNGGNANQLPGGHVNNGLAGANINNLPNPNGWWAGEPIAWVDTSTRFLQLNYMRDPSDPRFPADAAPMGSLTRMTLNSIDNSDNRHRGRNFTARANAAYDWLFMDEFASTFSFGAKGKFMFNERYRLATGTHLNITDATTNPIYLTQFIMTQQLAPNFLNGGIRGGFGAAADLRKVQDFMRNNPDRFPIHEERTARTFAALAYEGWENVTGAFVMNQTQFNNLMVLAGVRVEDTRVRYKANIVHRYNSQLGPDVLPPHPDNNPNNLPTSLDAHTITPIEERTSYTIVLPNLQFRYNLGRNTIFRLAYTTGYSRPNLPDLVPAMDWNEDMGRLDMGNPDLLPAFSHNFNFIAEHFLPRIGLLSGGVFFMHINDFLFQHIGAIPQGNPFFDPDNIGNLRQMRNGAAAMVYGAEFTLNSRLPGVLQNFMITSNYTFNHSDAQTTVDDDNPENNRGNMRLPGQARHSGNLALSFSNRRFTVQAAANFNGNFIHSLGDREELDVWVDSRWQVDLNASVNLIPGMQWYAEAVNILNAPAYFHWGQNREHVWRLEYTGVFLRTGISYRF